MIVKYYPSSSENDWLRNMIPASSIDWTEATKDNDKFDNNMTDDITHLFYPKSKIDPDYFTIISEISS